MIAPSNTTPATIRVSRSSPSGCDGCDGISAMPTSYRTDESAYFRRARRGRSPRFGGLVLLVIYLPGMSSGADVGRRHGEVFDDVAEEYDRHRPAYPDALIDRACEVADLGPGAKVLEIGCGTGQLTRSLLARGLRVTAIEPGERLLARARGQLAHAGEVHFVN